MKNLLAKLLAAQKKIEPIEKKENNPYFKSKYFDINAVLEHIKPVLSEVGLVVLQPLVDVNGKPAIQTIIADPESGEVIEKTTPLIENTDAQKFGGTITYQRRYALTSFLCLQGEKDDDGNTATGKAKVEEPVYEEPFLDHAEPAKPIQEGDQCPKCQVGTLKLKNGKYGPYIACNMYPKCKHTVSV